MVGKKRFKHLYYRNKLSDFVTISDEALALVIFLNNYLSRMDMGKTGDWATSSMPPIFTTGGDLPQMPKSGKGNKKYGKIVPVPSTKVGPLKESEDLINSLMPTTHRNSKPQSCTLPQC